jgi:hypothetical protein
VIVYDDLVGIFARMSGHPARTVRSTSKPERGWWYSAGLADDSLIATFLRSRSGRSFQCGRAVTWRKQLEDQRSPGRAALRSWESDAMHCQPTASISLKGGWLAVGDAAELRPPSGDFEGLEWG